MEKKEIIDIENINKEFEKIRSRLRLLSDRFLAIAMDYKHYIDGSFKESKIYELRDSVQYRFFSAKFHVEMLLNHHLIIQNRLEESLKHDPHKITGDYFPFNPFFDIYQKEISSIFDSFIYHTVSVFDYISTLINYISGVNKEDTLMWTQLAKSIRDIKNNFSKKTFSETIDKIDKDFVGKLYDHRALIIHRKADISGYNVTLFLGTEEKIKARFLAGKNLIKSFSELKILSKEKNLTVNFVTFWILNKTIDKVTDILFALKKEIESNSRNVEPFMYYLDPKTKKSMPVSVNYWHENLYLNDKNK